MTREKASQLTGFDFGEQFSSPQEVREYFTVSNIREMFGGPVCTSPPPETDADDGCIYTTQRELDEMAEAVIENGWHCRCGPRAEGGSVR